MGAAAPSFVARITETDLRLLRIFRVVAEAGGLSAAETTLRMERSTISRHVQALEARLGGALCSRGPGGFALTELGDAAMRAAVTACDTLDLVRDQLNGAHEAIGGELKIGLADNCLTNPNSQIVEALRRFRSEAPAVDLHVSIKPPIELVADILSRRLHLAIAGSYTGDPKLAATPLFTEEFRLYTGASADERATAPELVARDYAVITRDRDRHSLALANRLGAEHSIVASGLESVATLLASGRCLGFLPTHLACSLKNSHVLVEVTGARSWSYISNFSLLRDAGRQTSRAGSLMARTLVDVHSEAKKQVEIWPKEAVDDH